MSTAANADDDPFASWVGIYQSASVRDATMTIKNAIDEGTKDMGPLRRSVARKRLAALNRAFAVIRIVETGGHLVVDFDGLPMRAPLSGKPEQNIDSEDRPVMASYRTDGYVLHARYVASDGEKRGDFEQAPGGRELTVHVTVLSTRLPQPIQYSIRFVRRLPGRHS